MEVEKIVNAIETEYHNRLADQMEKIIGEKEDEIRLLKMQLAKTRIESHDDLQKQLEFQKNFIKQEPDEAARAERRTMAARSSEDGQFQCYNMRFVENLKLAEKLTDEQACQIIHQNILGKNCTIVGGVHMYVEDALREIGTEQRQRALAKMNAQSPRSNVDEPSEKDMMELFNKIRGQNIHAIGANTTSYQPSMAASTPPRPPTQSHNYNDHDDDDNDNWVMSVIKRNSGGNGGGDDGGDEGGEVETRENRHQDGSGDLYNANQEFTLVNPRNIEMKIFTEETNSKMSYAEFKDSQRELVGIKERWRSAE